MWTNNIFKVKKVDLGVQTWTHGLPSHPGPAEVHAHVEFLKPEEQAVGETASPCNKDNKGHLLQDLAIQEMRGGGWECTYSSVLPQKMLCYFVVLLFFLFSTGLCLAASGRQWVGEGEL